jgi:hypothetical protein
MKMLFLAWRSPETHSWYPIGKLIQEGKEYQFVYTKGIVKAKDETGFNGLISFPNTNEIYHSEELFPFFANRVLSPSRPDYKNFIEWLNLSENNHDPVAILTASGGRRETDTLEVFSLPEKNEQGEFHIHFFVHGLRHLPESSKERILQLTPEDRLFMCLDFQNPYDRNAVMLRTNDLLDNKPDRYIVGYCPRYLKSDILELIMHSIQQTVVKVERVNLPPAPMEYRLLCSLTAPWTDNFNPFSSEEFQPIVEQEILHS